MQQPQQSTGGILSVKDISKKFGGGTVLLTVREVSERFGVSRSWIYAHREIPTLRLGRGIRFIEADLVAYFKRQSLRLR